MRKPVVLGTSHQYRHNLQITEPTPEQIKRRERDEWNARVEARKAAKKGQK
jgi:hypothetical protein